MLQSSPNSDVLPPVELLNPAVATFIGCVNEIIVHESIPIAATAIKDGHIILLLGSLYLRLSNQGRAEILKHECGHFLMGHLARALDRNLDKWNKVCDASIHFSGICDWQGVEVESASIGWPLVSVTYERLIDKTTELPMMPMPPEISYERLKDDDEQEGCGFARHGSDDGSNKSLVRRIVVAQRIASADPDFFKALTGGAGHESSSRMAPELKGPRPWIRQVIQYLIDSRERGERRRSWRREHRVSDLLPGQSRRFSKGGKFFLDASGSIPDDQLGEFLACVQATPELNGSDVSVFDTEASEPIPITDIKRIVETCKRMGGGTHIKGVGEAHRDERPAIWITDAYTGDGWPRKHTTTEVWCVWGKGPTPPNGVTIHIPE